MISFDMTQRGRTIGRKLYDDFLQSKYPKVGIEEVREVIGKEWPEGLSGDDQDQLEQVVLRAFLLRC